MRGFVPIKLNKSQDQAPTGKVGHGYYYKYS